MDFLAVDLDPPICYRPRWNQFTGHPNATLLLQEIVYWWSKSGCRPFYKFNAPCQHEKYREGDSFTEALGFTEEEFSTARSRIAAKVTKGSSKKQLYDNSLVIYWTDSNRLTWYEVNEHKLNEELVKIYPAKSSPVDDLNILDNLLRVEKQPDPQTSPVPGVVRKPANPGLLSSSVTASDNTPENTNASGFAGRTRDAFGAEEGVTMSLQGSEKKPGYRDCERVALLTAKATKLTEAQIRTMNTEVVWFDPQDLQCKTKPSPNELWDTDELYRQWVKTVMWPWLKKKFPKTQPSRSKAIEQLRNYIWFYEWRSKQTDPKDIRYPTRETPNIFAATMANGNTSPATPSSDGSTLNEAT